MPDFTIYSTVNDFYAAKQAPQSIVNYPEAVFLQAEAVFRTAGTAAATPVYINALHASMDRQKLDTTSAAVTAYVAGRIPLTRDNAAQSDHH